jgi:perosamine synthetase
LTIHRFTRLAPGGSPIPASSLRALLREDDPEATLRRQLADRFVDKAFTLHASGREALRVAFAQLSAATNRSEIAIPAYSCFSIPAAAVAAGLRVRLVDVDARGQLDLGSLERLPLERVAAVTVTNLFGVPEPIRAVCRLAREAGATVIDDAAQTFGGVSAEGPVGGRADVGVLSFGRGKPLSALGGGALVCREDPPDGAAANAAEEPKRWAALLRAIIYDAARIPVVLRGLSAIPALGIGTTEYDPGFSRGSMPGAAVTLAAVLLPELDAANRSRTQRANALAARLANDTDFKPLVAGPGDIGIYPRLGVLAPTRARRDAALAALVPFGATRMYPTPLGEISGLRPHLVGETGCPGADDFCGRLLTLPTHAGLRGRRLDKLLALLRSA